MQVSNAQLCDWCARTSRQTRVTCTGPRRFGSGPCGHQRILELSPKCQSCGSYDYAPVQPSKGDLIAQLLVLAGQLVTLDPSPAHLDIAMRIGAIEAALGAETPIDPWSVQ